MVFGALTKTIIQISSVEWWASTHPWCFLFLFTLWCAFLLCRRNKSICSLLSKIEFLLFCSLPFRGTVLFPARINLLYSFDKIIFLAAFQALGFLFRLSATSLWRRLFVRCGTRCILELFSRLNYIPRERKRDERAEWILNIFALKESEMQRMLWRMKDEVKRKTTESSKCGARHVVLPFERLSLTFIHSFHVFEFIYNRAQFRMFSQSQNNELRLGIVNIFPANEQSEANSSVSTEDNSNQFISFVFTKCSGTISFDEFMK